MNFWKQKIGEVEMELFWGKSSQLITERDSFSLKELELTGHF